MIFIHVKGDVATVVRRRCSRTYRAITPASALRLRHWALRRAARYVAVMPGCADLPVYEHASGVGTLDDRAFAGGRPCYDFAYVMGKD
jgi:hypothetical protein